MINLSRRFPLIGLIAFYSIACQSSEKSVQIIDRDDTNFRNKLRTSIAIFNDSGARKRWNDLLSAAESADVIIFGEQHDDAIGHAMQRAFVEDALTRWPDTAVSMEMFDRSEQAVVDDYLAGIVDRATFYEEISPVKARKTARSFLDSEIDRDKFEQRMFSLGWPDWEKNYQPIVDAAKTANAKIIASNTPWLRYTRLANKEGLQRLDSLTPAQRALVAKPPMLPGGSYRDRFFGLMSGMGGGHSGDGAHSGVDEDMILGMYRAQCVMDATMAASIADHLDQHGGKVIHLVGQFHSDYDGGLIQQLRHMRPGARVLNISLQTVEAESLRDEDRSRADYVVYTKID